MHKSPQAIQLSEIFNELDTNKEGSINQDQFTVYISKQPRNIPNYLITQLFSLLPHQRMNQQAFVFYMMGYRMNMEHFAISRFAMQKHLGVHVNASPPSGANQIRRNNLKFSVASKSNIHQGQKHKLHISIGRDQKGQSQKFQQLQNILGHKPQDIIGVIKFKVACSHEQIRKGIETVIQNVKAILSEMDEQLFRIIQLFKFSVKVGGEYIYILIQVGHVFLIQFVNFVNQIIQSLSQDALLVLSALIQTNYFKNFLKQGSQKKIQDLQINFGLNVDNESMKKLKQILSDQNVFKQTKKPFGILLLLFKQINLQASFSNSQKLFNHLGLSNSVSESKLVLNSLKDMSIKQTLEGFVPQSVELLQNLTNHGVGDGQISINLKHLFIKVEFNLEIQGLLSLL